MMTKTDMKATKTATPWTMTVRRPVVWDVRPVVVMARNLPTKTVTVPVRAPLAPKRPAILSVITESFGRFTGLAA